MATDNRDLFQEALALPLAERAALTEVLIDSLPANRQSDIQIAWRAEVQRRIEAFDRGESQAIDAEQVFDELLGRGD